MGIANTLHMMYNRDRSKREGLAQMTNLKEANQYMSIAAKYLRMNVHSAVSSPLCKARELLIECRLSKGSEKAWSRFSKLNDKMNKYYAS